MPKKTLSDEIKTFIVHALACYDTPSAVAESVKQEFGAAVTRQQVERYNPMRHAGHNLSEKWRDLFHATRKAFKEQTADIPVASRAYRLRSLQRLFEKAEASKNMVLAANLLKQAAEEVGDVYTNRQKIDAKVQATARTVIVPTKMEKSRP